MRLLIRLAVLLLFVCKAAAQTAPGPLKTEAPTVAKLFDVPLTNLEHELVPLAEAMPAARYNFAPTQGEFKTVRTFAAQVKHVAAVIYMVAAAARKEKPPVELGSESGPESIKTKEQIVQFLKDSFAYAHKAALSLTAQNQLELVKSPFGDGDVTRAGAANIALWHSFDHYGQMVVYARMNGVIPPASK